MENQKIYQNYFFILNFFQKVKFSKKKKNIFK